MQVLSNNVLFKFVDDVTESGDFKPKNQDGVIQLVGSTDGSARQPREAIAIYVGPDCKTIKAGDHFVIPALRWTLSFKYEGARLWKTDESEIAAVISGAEVAAINDFVVFMRDKPKPVTSSMGIIIVHQHEESQRSGKVLSIGADVDGDALQVGNSIVFDSPTFNDDFSYKGLVWSFVREKEVLFVKE